MLRVTGGRDSRKTWANLIRLTLHDIAFPGSWGMIVALINDKHRDTIIPKLEDLWAMLDFKSGTHYEYNKNDREYTLYNQSKIYLRTAEEPKKLPGPDLAWFVLDEWREMPEEVFSLLVPTLRQHNKRHPEMPHWCGLGSTPGPADHWSRKIWLPDVYAREFGVPIPKRRAGTYINYNPYTRDTPGMTNEDGSPTDRYLMWVEQYGGEHTRLARRELFGEELVLEGLVCETWDPAKHIVHPDKWPSKPSTVLIGADFGFATRAALLVYGLDSEGRRYVMDEWYAHRANQYDMAAKASEFADAYDADRVLCDSENPEAIYTMRQAGLRAVPAQKTMRARGTSASSYALLDRAVSHTVDGKQAFFVHPRCTNFRSEIEGFIYKDDDSEKPVKKNDHLCDAWRYCEIFASLHLRPESQEEATEMSFRMVA